MELHRLNTLRLATCALSLVLAGAQRSRVSAAEEDTAPIDLPASVPWKPIFQGVEYAKLRAARPRPMAVHAARIDLRHPGITVTSTIPNGEKPGETDGLRTSSFLVESGCQLAVNAAPFSPIHPNEGLGQDVHGLLVHDGQVVSKPDRGLPALLVRKGNRAEIARTGFSLENVETGVGGFSVVLEKGEVVGRSGPVHPRTAAGVSGDGRYLFLLVIDGRQKGTSEGATTAEVGLWLRHLGARDGINLDGGGTSTMVMEAGGKPRLLNRPIHAGLPGRERVSACHLGVRALPLE